jgi:ATP-dependent RNA helicase DeaD
LINKVKDTEVKEKDIEEFLPKIMSDFEHLSKEEVIKKFISVEFNRFVEYYSKAQDLNVSESRDRRERGERGDRDRGERGGERRERFDRDDSNRTRFFVSLGKRDGLNPGGLLRLICDEAGLTSSSVGKIDVMPSFSFFEADNSHTEAILKAVNGANYEGNRVSVEITKKKAERRSGGGDRDRGFSGSRDRNDRGGERRSGGGFGERKREGGGFGSRSGGGDRDRDRNSSRPRSRSSYGRNN